MIGQHFTLNIKLSKMKIHLMFEVSSLTQEDIEE